ncbi:hypothetical protein PUV54_01115 [Hyphococcus flavus]|uniref:Uncharacterized protein n=1 Tax=Hyphococcus flavus TaxID=1866326 RepID=A0AAE9ZJM9_9PROT|nr:hypothetical protein [Hyphococcus flavus]WDI31785.1 hypothetical protein PUV54_01115 [Hyphococcus flavus]
MVALRTLAIGLGAGSAAVAAFVTQQLDDDNDQPRTSQSAYEICLKTDMPLFEDASARCYGHADLSALQDQKILDLQGKSVTLVMSDPGGHMTSQREVQTCRAFRELSFDGWYAGTTREMRREGYFIRACGALFALMNAQPANGSHFQDGSPTKEDLALLRSVMRLGEEAGGSTPLSVEQPSAHQWRISENNQFVEMQELANADFDSDGVEEILFFLAGGTRGGSALFYDVGLLEKDAKGAALVFTPVSHNPEAGARAAG